MVLVQTQSTDSRVLERQRNIVLAAAEEFRLRGFHKTGMRDIARRVGVTVGNLYYYFKNKNDLLRFCQADTLSRLQDLATSLADDRRPVDERLYLLIRGHVVCLNEGVPASLAHLEVPDDPGADRLKKQRDRYESLIRQVIDLGIQDGTFRAVDSKTAALAILGAVNWTVRWFRPDGRASAAAIGEAFAEQLVGGLLAPGRKLNKPEPLTREKPS